MDLRIVLLGKTGAGKSASGNTILKGNFFEVKYSPKSVTTECELKEVGRVKVIDTPGMFSTLLAPYNLNREINECVRMSAPGPHVFLLVIKLGVFTMEERNTIKWIQEKLGIDASLYIIVLFTHADQLGEKKLESFLAESLELRKLLNSLGNRYHAFNNKDPSPSQVEGLMQKIDDMVLMNGGEPYTKMIDKSFKNAWCW